MTDSFRSGDPLVAFDGSLRILAWNQAAEELTGIPAEEAIDRPCWDVLSGRDSHGGLICHAGCSSFRLAAKGWPVHRQPLSIKTATGRRAVSMSTIAVDNGDAPVFLHLLRNGAEVAEGEYDAPDRGRFRPARLTPRQREVLQLLAEGLPAKRIASRLQIAEPTVRNHIRLILLELGAHSQLEAVAEARRRRLLT